MSEEEDKAGVSVDGKLVITDLLGLGKAVEKLTPAATKIVDAIQAGVGKVYEPASLYFNARAQNAADRHNALADAKAFLEVETRSPVVLQSLRERVLRVEYRRQENILAAQVEAAQIAQALPSETASDIDPDFYVEWMEGVKDVSQEALRSAWARMLAEAPQRESGRVPKPIVDFLRTLDGDLASELKWAYDRRTPTTELLPYAEADVSELAEEIGIGSHIQLPSLSIFDGSIRFTFSPVPVSFFQLSTRASQLAAVLFPKEENSEATGVEFLENLPDWIKAVSQSAEAGDQIVIWVQTDKGHAKFKVLPAVAPMHNIEQRDALHRINGLSAENPLEVALQHGLRALTQQFYTSVIVD